MGIFKKLQEKIVQGQKLTREEKRFIFLNDPWTEKSYKIENGHIVTKLVRDIDEYS
jgi:hypothetical protein